MRYPVLLKNMRFYGVAQAGARANPAGRAGRRACPGLLFLEPDVALVVHLDRVGLEVDGAGGGGGFAGLDVEQALVEGAFDLAVDDEAFGEVGGAVGADVVGGVDLAVEFVDADGLVAEVDGVGAFFGYVGGIGYVGPFAHA